MPLETGTKPADLNGSWPLNIDPASLGAAHLRLLKTVLKNNLLGTFLDKAAFKTFFTDNSLTPSAGCIVAIANRLYVYQSVSGGIPAVDGRDWFFIEAGKRFQAISEITQAGFTNSQNTSGLAAINSSQARRPLVRYVQVLSGTSFDVGAANAAFPNGVAIANDICIQLIVGSTSYSFVRFYTGSSWTDIDFKVYNRAAAFANLAAQLISAVSVDTDRVRTAVQEVVGAANMYVRNPDGFGPDSLTSWFGPKEGLIGFNGEIQYNSLTKLNAVRYETVTGGTGGAGTDPVEPPAPPLNATVLDALGTLGASYAALTQTYQNNGGSSYCGINFGTNGVFSLSAFDDPFGTPASGAFLSDTTPGIGDQFEVRFEPQSGSFTGTLDTWLPLTSSRLIRVFISRVTEGTSTQSGSVLIRVRKAGDVASEKTKTISLQATADVNASAIP